MRPKEHFRDSHLWCRIYSSRGSSSFCLPIYWSLCSLASPFQPNRGVQNLSYLSPFTTTIALLLLIHNLTSQECEYVVKLKLREGTFRASSAKCYAAYLTGQTRGSEVAMNARTRYCTHHGFLCSETFPSPFTVLSFVNAPYPLSSADWLTDRSTQLIRIVRDHSLETCYPAQTISTISLLP